MFSICALISFHIGLAQSYNVMGYQKINETNGNFTGNLDNFDSWGIAIDNIGDLDGNGFNDLAVGAYTDDDGGTNRGAVYILFLSADNQVISHTKISDSSGNFTGVLNNDDRFGGSVSFLGDLNNDGRIELAVGADYDGDGGYWHGAVWILSLNNDGTVFSHTKISDTQGGFNGPINNDAIFGTDMENIGDLNNDGITDLAVGARRDADGGSRRGAVWILFMNADLTVNSYQKISDTQGGFTPNLDFEDYFGGSILNIGDQNSDGTNDIIVGAYRDDDQNINSGSFYLLYLNQDGTVQSSVKVSNTSGGLSNQISANALFGESIDGTNDIDGDGKPEILVGALGHYNPTLATNTGAFYMIEVNSDGSVSEDRFYTYGEYCFSGELNSGDYFGGAITLLNQGPNPKIAVSAYHDSENGTEKGAVWILDLGEIEYSISSGNDASCGSDDGSFVISDVAPNLDYTIQYDFNGSSYTDYYMSDEHGSFNVENLFAGNYENIIITESMLNCSDELGNFTVNGNSIEPTINPVAPTSCGNTDGQIEIFDLVAGSTYQVTYEHNSSTFNVNSQANANGNLTINNLSEGIYHNFIITDLIDQCETMPIDITLNENVPNPDIIVNNPTSCGVNDGSISLIGLRPTSEYIISYDHTGDFVTDTFNSDTNGEVLVGDLFSGSYENLTVTESWNSCSTNLGAIQLVDMSLQVTASVIDPTSCGLANGQILLDGLLPDSEYSVRYTFNGENLIVQIPSNNKGQVSLNDLGAGNYTNITMSNQGTGCTISIDELILNQPGLSPVISVEPPTSCISEDGYIYISNLLPNATYSISYMKDSREISLQSSTAGNGTLSLNFIAVGKYEHFTISNAEFQCSFIEPLIEVSCNGNLIGCFIAKSFFSPNGDGINDVWQLETLNDCSYEVFIYNRYGKLLSVLSPNNPKWDGTYAGNPMPSSDYWYSVKYYHNDTYSSYQSHFTLKR